MNKIVIYRVDDWECMYVNGVDQYQGHSIPLFELTLHCPIESMEVKWANKQLDIYTKGTGNFPQFLDECLEIEAEHE